MTPAATRRTAKQLLVALETISGEARELLRQAPISTTAEIAISTELYVGMERLRTAIARLDAETRVTPTTDAPLLTPPESERMI